MGRLRVSFACALCFLPALIGAEPASSYLTTTIQRTNGSLTRSVEAYTPQAGDLILYEEPNWVHEMLYRFAGTETPNHVGIVVGLSDGRLATLEAKFSWQIWHVELFLREVIRLSPTNRLRQVVQLHLSRECNRPSLAADSARLLIENLDGDIEIHTARQDRPIRTIVIEGMNNGVHQLPGKNRPNRQAQLVACAISQRSLPGIDA